MIRAGDVIQATETTGEWCGCLLIVKESSEWGVMAGMRVPCRGSTYIRLKHDQYEYIGQAVLIEAESDE